MDHDEAITLAQRAGEFRADLRLKRASDEYDRLASERQLGGIMKGNLRLGKVRTTRLPDGSQHHSRA